MAYLEDEWRDLGMVNVDVMDTIRIRNLGSESLHLLYQVIEGRTYFALYLDSHAHVLTGKTSKVDQNSVELYMKHNDKRYTCSIYSRPTLIEEPK